MSLAARSKEKRLYSQAEAWSGFVISFFSLSNQGEFNVRLFGATKKFYRDSGALTYNYLTYTRTCHWTGYVFFLSSLRSVTLSYDSFCERVQNRVLLIKFQHFALKQSIVILASLKRFKEVWKALSSTPWPKYSALPPPTPSNSRATDFPGVTPRNSWWGCAARFSKSWLQCHFPHPFSDQEPVVQKVDNAIYWRNLYPVHNAIVFPYTYPLDSDLSGG